jgi:hypothetical protein
MAKRYASVYTEYNKLLEQLGDSEEYSVDRENAQLVERAKKLKGRNKLAVFRELEKRVLDSENAAQSMYRVLTRLDITLNNYGKNSYLRKGLEEIRNNVKKNLLDYYQPLQQKSALDRAFNGLEASIDEGFTRINKSLEEKTIYQRKTPGKLDVLWGFELTASHPTERGLLRRRALEKEAKRDALKAPLGIAAAITLISATGFGAHKGMQYMERKYTKEQSEISQNYDLALTQLEKTAKREKYKETPPTEMIKSESISSADWFASPNILSRRPFH